MPVLELPLVIIVKVFTVTNHHVTAMALGTYGIFKLTLSGLMNIISRYLFYILLCTVGYFFTHNHQFSKLTLHF